jgi:hypothetical protein
MVFHSVLATRAVLHISAVHSKVAVDSACTLSRYRSLPRMAFAAVGDVGVAEVTGDLSLIQEEI